MPITLTFHVWKYTITVTVKSRNRHSPRFRVREKMIQMYWEIGEYVSRQVKNGGWGKSIVKEFSAFLQAHYPASKGFSPQNIWRMKQFYETYTDLP